MPNGKKNLTVNQWYAIGKEWIIAQRASVTMRDFAKRYEYNPSTVRHRLKKLGFNVSATGWKLRGVSTRS